VGRPSGRIGAALAVGALLASVLGAGPAAAADPPPDVVLDGVVTVHQVDPADGALAGATITILAGRDPIGTFQVVTGATNASGIAVLSGVARPADGAPAVLLDIHSDKTLTVVDERGCIVISSWSSAALGIVAAPVVDVVLDPAAKSESVDCPEPSDEVPPDDPSDAPPRGGILGASGRPAVTPPSTDAAGSGAVASETPLLPGLLIVLGFVAVIAQLRTPASAIRGPRRRGR
jgi:hypothetical protein